MYREKQNQEKKACQNTTLQDKTEGREQPFRAGRKLGMQEEKAEQKRAPDRKPTTKTQGEERGSKAARGKNSGLAFD